MSKIYLIAKGEFCRYFISPLAYVFLCCFLLLNGSFTLYFGGLFTQGNASLKPMFEILPWVFLLFVPAIAMRLWAEEFKSGTILQIMTLPVSVSEYVWGKFLAAWAFCLTAIVLTFPFVITLNVLGNPDNGVIFNGYLGAFLLSGAMLAIAQTASALTKNQVIALIIAILINILFFLSGLEYVLGFFRGKVPHYIVDLVSSFSFLTHMHIFSLGLLELRGVVFFVSLIFVFNFFTTIIVNFRTVGAVFWLKKISLSGCVAALFLVFVAFIGINLFTNSEFLRFSHDFTSEKFFTPSSSTKNILKNLPSQVTAKVYYSPILGERDESFRQSFDDLKVLLEKYKRISNGKFNYKIYNPEPLSDIEDKAIFSGLQGLPVSDLNVAAYYGIVFVNENGKSRTIPFLPLARAGLLEQDLTENIYLLEHDKKTVGILTSLPMLGHKQDNFAFQSWQITEEIGKFYVIKKITKPEDLKDIDVLLIAHPQGLSENLEKAVYDFSISGGKVLAFFDVAPESLHLVGPQTKILYNSDYGSLPEKWGFKFFGENVVADLDNSSQIFVETADYSGAVQDLIQFFVLPKNMLTDFPEIRNIKRMLMTSASFFVPTDNSENFYFIPLIGASKQSQIMSSMVVSDNIHPTEILRNFKADNYEKILAAHVVSQKEGNAFELIVVGDSDLLYDSFWTNSVTIGEQNYNVPLLDNGNFVLNSLDVLIGNEKLIDLRGKTLQKRNFDYLEKQQKQIVLQFRIKEKDIFDQIVRIKNGLQEITGKRNFEERENFTPEELAVINKIKNALEEKRRELYGLRKSLNDNLKKAEKYVNFFNIYAIPFLIVAVVLFKNRNFKFVKPSCPAFNKKFYWLFLVSAFCVGAGVLSVVLRPDVNSLDFEGKPLFENLVKRINDVEKIEMNTSKNSLVLHKENDKWLVDGKEDFLVVQKRVKSFLTMLLQATIYEKKANKIENLSQFGLLPISDKKSKAVKVVLKDKEGKKIEEFDVGDYNVDLGRGALGAYVRMPDKFQTWLVNVDLIDMSIDYKDWTFATLWNLQLGRFATFNGEKNADKLANLMKEMLNIKIENAEEKGEAKFYKKIELEGEFFDKLTINFYKKGDKFLVQYVFSDNIKNSVLKDFSDHTKGRFYLISSENMKKIENGIK